MFTINTNDYIIYSSPIFLYSYHKPDKYIYSVHTRFINNNKTYLVLILKCKLKNLYKKPSKWDFLKKWFVLLLREAFNLCFFIEYIFNLHMVVTVVFTLHNWNAYLYLSGVATAEAAEKTAYTPGHRTLRSTKLLLSLYLL